MYHIENKLTNTTNLYEDIDSMLIGLNTILSGLYDESNVLIDIEEKDDMIIYKINDTILTSNIIPNKLNYFPYFVLPKTILSQYFTNHFMNITSEFLLNVFTSKKCIADPYNVLLNVFHVNEELIYQTFILFLNKTILNNHKTNPLNLTDVFENFFIRNHQINHKNYNRLFTYFLSAKKIYPFMIKYENYVSVYDV